jgi:hypothetical protein
MRHEGLGKNRFRVYNHHAYISTCGGVGSARILPPQGFLFAFIIRAAMLKAKSLA